MLRSPLITLPNGAYGRTQPPFTDTPPHTWPREVQVWALAGIYGGAIAVYADFVSNGRPCAIKLYEVVERPGNTARVRPVALLWRKDRYCSLEEALQTRGPELRLSSMVEFKERPESCFYATAAEAYDALAVAHNRYGEPSLNVLMDAIRVSAWKEGSSWIGDIEQFEVVRATEHQIWIQERDAGNIYQETVPTYAEVAAKAANTKNTIRRKSNERAGESLARDKYFSSATRMTAPSSPAAQTSPLAALTPLTRQSRRFEPQTCPPMARRRSL